VSSSDSNEFLTNVTVLPLTSHKGGTIYPNEIFIESSEGSLLSDLIALAHKIRTISKERLGSTIGENYSECRTVVKNRMGCLRTQHKERLLHMPFMTFGKDHVFISWGRWHSIRAVVLKDKSAQFRGLSTMQFADGNKAKDEAENLMYNYLELQKKSDPLFYHKWVEFYFDSAEAQADIINLMMDYLHLYQFGSIKDIRETKEEFDFLAPSEFRIMERPSFLLEIESCPRQKWKVFFKKSPTVQLWVNIWEIERIEGTLRDFTVYMPKWRLSFSEMGIKIKIH
jgi:mRNA-degrading endonuclease toxin of MazEF toxin-antitoxin module